MRERIFQAKKAASPVSISTLKQPTRGFGLESLNASPPAMTQVQPLNKPLSHDISKISLRPQAKLSISQPGDFYEQQADSVAQQVMRRMAQPTNRHSIQRQEISEETEETEDTDLQMKPLVNFVTPLVQRQQAPEEEEETTEPEPLQMKSLVQRQQAPEEEEETTEPEPLQMKSLVQRQAKGGIAATSDLETSINQARGGGQPLGDNIREPMEQAFGADFGGVKVHTDSQSHQLNQSIQARAFTTGQDIFFRQGEYNPGSPGGQELLAHELTHVVQQNGGMVHIASSVIQRLIGAGDEDGQEVTLPGVAESLGEAAKKSALYINTQARTANDGVPEERLSQLGNNNPGNLYIKSLFDEGSGEAWLETWSEMTQVGGGYVKRVRVTRPGQPIMDRVMNEAEGNAFQMALAADRNPIGPLAGNERYDSVHLAVGEDAAGLSIYGDTERTADNLTKMVGEGARFPWLAERLSTERIGNETRNLLKIQVSIPQEGTFTMDPTFQELWGAWDSAFNKSYIKDLKAAKSIVQQRLREGWRSPKDNDVAGPAPLQSGETARHQVTSLSRRDGKIALMPAQGDVNGPTIVSALGMTWNSDR